MTFNGTQHVLVSAGGAVRSQAEEVVLRFRTKFPVGLLLATSSDTAADRLDLVLSGGRVRANVRLGDREKVGRAVTDWEGLLKGSARAPLFAVPTQGFVLGLSELERTTQMRIDFWEGFDTDPQPDQLLS